MPLMLLSLLGDLAALLAASYGTLALFAVGVSLWRRPPARRASRLPPVTILKPLCGSEPLLYENLRSFCTQDYPQYQIIFGLNDANDPALAVAEQLRTEFSHLAIDIVVSSQSIGSNRKVDNLANMLPAAEHDYLMIADSDIRVPPDYLQRVTAPLTDSTVGIVTCLYRAYHQGGRWSRLGSLFVNDWFGPSVWIARLFGSTAFAFGATIGIRRDHLEAIGGLPAIANHLADDYMLGALTRAKGLRTVLSDCVVETLVHEPRFSDLMAHELRWLRTIRMVQPRSYDFLFISCVMPLALIGGLLAAGQPLALFLMTVAILTRIMQRGIQARLSGVSVWTDLWLLPVREFLTAYLWFRGLLSRRILWRNHTYAVARDGSLHKTI